MAHKALQELQDFFKDCGHIVEVFLKSLNMLEIHVCRCDAAIGMCGATSRMCSEALRWLRYWRELRFREV